MSEAADVKAQIHNLSKANQFLATVQIQSDDRNVTNAIDLIRQQLHHIQTAYYMRLTEASKTPPSLKGFCVVTNDKTGQTVLATPEAAQRLLKQNK